MHTYAMTHEIANHQQGERLRQAELDALIALCRHGARKPGGVAAFRRASGDAFVCLGVWLRGASAVERAAGDLRSVAPLRIAD